MRYMRISRSYTMQPWNTNAAMRKGMIWYKSAEKGFQEPIGAGRRDKQPSRAFTVRRYKAERRKCKVSKYK